MQIISRLLAFAAGIVIFCSCSNDQKPHAVTQPQTKKDLLTGRWTLDSIDLSHKKDTSELGVIVEYLIGDDRYEQVQFAFSEDGTLTEYDDSSKTSGRFDWQGDTAIALADTEPKEIFLIKTVDAENLVVQTADTVGLFFRRIKEK